jgi:hypothetical protein
VQLIADLHTAQILRTHGVFFSTPELLHIMVLRHEENFTFYVD